MSIDFLNNFQKVTKNNKKTHDQKILGNFETKKDEEIEAEKLGKR